MKFENYRIAEGIKTSIFKLGYKKPTDIQYKAIPPILKGEDVLAIAQTGTGKTAAFVIPILHLLQERKKKTTQKGVKCLVLAPTHELAIQTHSVFETIGENTNIKSVCIHGGVDQTPQIKELTKGAEIVIATPGRMFDLVSQGALNLKTIEILVLDEADHMLDLGFIRDIKDLMRHIPMKRQTLFFSATINLKIKDLAYSMVNKAIRIQISPKDPVSKNIDHSVAFIEMDDKRFFLESLIKNHSDKKILVFVRTKVRAERVKKALERVNIDSDTIHSDREQKDREKIMNAFDSGQLKILIATDVSARGIDIKDVEFVVNYDLPESLENYVHRVGRTGRGTQKGQAITFCSTEEKTILADIEANLGKEIKKIILTKNEYNFTIENTEDTKFDWKKLVEETEKEEQEYYSKKKKKRN